MSSGLFPTWCKTINNLTILKPKQDNMKRVITLILTLIFLGWYPQQIDGCLTRSLQAPSRIRLHSVHTIGNRLIFGDTQGNLQIYNPQDGSWTQKPSHLASTPSFPLPNVVLDQQLVFISDRIENSSAASVIDFRGPEPRERLIHYNSNLHHQTIALIAVGNSAIFVLYNQLAILDVETDTFREVQFDVGWEAETSDQDNIYCFNYTHSIIYSLNNNSWTVIPYQQGIFGQRLQHVRLFNGSVLLISDTSILELNIWTGHWKQLFRHRSNFVSIASVTLHRSTLVLVAGTDLGRANIIFTYDLEYQLAFRIPYSHNFAGFTAYYQNKLYFSTTSPNVQVYDLDNTFYKRVHLPDSQPISTHLYTSAKYGDFYVVFNQQSNGSNVIMYDLNYGTIHSWTLAKRWLPHIFSSESYIAITAGYSVGLLLDVDIFNVQTAQWSQTTIPGSTSQITTTLVKESLVIAAVGNLHVFNISSSLWTTHKLAGSDSEFHHMLQYQDSVLIMPYYDDISAINMYNIRNQQLTFVPLNETRQQPGVILAGSQLYIAGGLSNNKMLSTIIVLDLETLTFAYTQPLSQARAHIHTAQVGDHLVFVSGVLSTGEVSAVIDILHIPSQYIYQMEISNPETFRLDLITVTVVGSFVCIQSESLLYVINPAQNGQYIIPSIGVRVSQIDSVPLHSYLVSHSVGIGANIFSFLEPAQRESWVIEVPPQFFIFSLHVWHSNAISMVGSDIVIFDLPAILNKLDDKKLFYPEDHILHLNATGHNLTYTWLLDGRPLEGKTTSAIRLYGNSSVPGIYQAIIQDHCLRRLSKSAAVTIIGIPQFSTTFDETIVLCGNQTIPFRVFATDAQDIQWTLNGNFFPADKNNDKNERSIPVTALTCGRPSCLCAIATNPSGPNKHCKQIHVVNSSSVFKGPTQLEKAFISVGSEVTLHVEILDPRCTSHTWYKDDTQWESTINDSQSYKKLTVTEGSEKHRYKVVAHCLQDSDLHSDVTYLELSKLPLWGLLMIVILGFIILAVIVIMILMFRVRLRKSKKQEVELKTLLNEAKQETMRNSTGLQIIKTKIWEWSPDNSFAFSPLDKLPVNIDTSHLGLSKKNDPVDVDYWVHGTISFTSKHKRKKASISSFLQQRLLEGHNIDIYVPQSPKFVVKVDQNSFTVDDDGSSVTLTVSVLMKMTTKAKIRLMVVLEKQKLYSSIDFSLVSKPSPWIDVDDIEMSEQVLGKGGFGTVTRGSYKGLDVAVKMLNNQYLMEHERVEFEREVSVMKSLHHPNIIQFVGASNVNQKLALVTEFAPLGSLTSALSDHLIPYKIKLAILIEIARAIQFLHSNNIIHRDIKPLNVLVFSLEPKAPVHVKLTDFGTSKFVTEMKATMTSNIGTISYMAPETLYDPPRFGTSADVYSFAILMWEVITNQEPFDGFKSMYDIEHFVMNGKRFEIPKEVDVKLAQLISECWAHDEAARPAMSVVIQQLSALFNEVNHY